MANFTIDLNFNVNTPQADAINARLAALEERMGKEDDAWKNLEDKLAAAEARDAAVKQLVSDLQTHFDELKATVGNNPDAVAKIEAIAARLEKLDSEAPPVVPEPPADGGGLNVGPADGGQPA